MASLGYPGTSYHSTVRSLSRIESIPVELLERIFSYTANPSFPRSSLVIGQKLSRPKIYELQCRRVFRFFKAREACPLYCTTQGCDTVENEKELSRAQTETLQCKWMTPSLFKNVVQEQLLQEEYSVRIQCLNNKTAPENSTIPPTEPLVDQRITQDLEIWLDESCHIPPSLLCWPLSDDKREFLDSLVMAGCTIDSFHHGEMALHAWKEAVQQRNYRMVCRYMSYGIQVRPTDNELTAALKALEWEIPMMRLIASAVMYSTPSDAVGFGIDFYEQNYPKTIRRLMAWHRPGTHACQKLTHFNAYDMVKIWNGTCHTFSRPRYNKDGAVMYEQIAQLGRWYAPGSAVARGSGYDERGAIITRRIDHPGYEDGDEELYREFDHSAERMYQDRNLYGK